MVSFAFHFINCVGRMRWCAVAGVGGIEEEPVLSMRLEEKVEMALNLVTCGGSGKRVC